MFFFCLPDRHCQYQSTFKSRYKGAKKFPEKTGGVYLIDDDEKRIKALKWLPIEDVWGIGSRHAKRLNALGITKAYAFTQLPDQWVRKNMSVVALRSKHELEGKPRLLIYFASGSVK